MMLSSPARRAATKLTLTLALTGFAGLSVGVPVAVSALSSSAAETTSRPSVDLLHAGHDVTDHGGYSSVPGVEGGVVLMEYTDNVYQTILVGGTPRAFEVDKENYSGPATFMTSDKLPDGLVLNTDGTWSGTATKKGDSVVNVKVSNGTTTFDLAFVLNVASPDSVGQAAWGSDATNKAQTIDVQGTPLDFKATGPAKLYFSSPSTMPPGLQLDPEGKWHGYATTPGTYTISVFVGTIYNREGVRQDFTLTVKDATRFGFTVAASNTLQNAVVGNYAMLPELELRNVPSITAPDGTKRADDVTYTLVSGSVPGMALRSVGQLVGTPTQAGTYKLVIKATTTASALEATTELVVEVDAADKDWVRFSDAKSNTTQQIETGTAPQALVVSTSDKMDLVFSLEKSESTLPEGLTLNADGTWSGVAKTQWVSQVKVLVTGTTPSGHEVYATSDFNLLVVDPAPEVATPAPPVSEVPDVVVEEPRPDGVVDAPSGEQLTPTEIAPSISVTCEPFQVQEAAQAVFDKDPKAMAALDADKDGVACEELPRLSGLVKSGDKAPAAPGPILTPAPSATPGSTPSASAPASAGTSVNGELNYTGDPKDRGDGSTTAVKTEAVSSDRLPAWLPPVAAGAGLFVLIAGGAVFWAVKHRSMTR
jgi:hypothetical protein